MEQTFQQFSDLCKKNVDKKHVQDILQIISISDCWFHPGMEGPREKISSLYRFRYDIADKTNEKRIEYYKDFENTIKELEKSKSESIGLTILLCENLSYLIFYEVNSQNICGILKSNKSDLDPRPDDIPDRTQPLENNPYFQKYSKGLLIK